MMKVFIVHSNSDNSEIEDCIQKICKECESVELLMLKASKNKLWKHEAKRQISRADCALYFVGKNSHSSKYIQWELKRFIGNGTPIYTIRLSPSNEYNEVLYRKHTYGNKEYIDRSKFMYSKEISIDAMCKLLNDDLELDISDDLSNNTPSTENAKLEQYKLYLQTSEDLVSRRQSVSNFYISVNSVLISIISAIVTFINLLDVKMSYIITICVCFLIPLVGIVLCLNWRKIILSYGQLNSAKMKVISAIEKKLPLNLYDVEWKVQTYKSGKKRYISFTNIEKRVPTIFLFLYGLFIISAIVLSMLLVFHVISI